MFEQIISCYNKKIQLVAKILSRERIKKFNFVDLQTVNATSCFKSDAYKFLFLFNGNDQICQVIKFNSVINLYCSTGSVKS